MVGSLWRYSHLVLALISALFLIVAAVTGAILAIEPMAKELDQYNAVALENVPLSFAVATLKENYDEVLELEVTPEHFVKASVFTFDGESLKIYVNPLTGEQLGSVKPQSRFFSFITNIHRSLFLKSLGRAFVGIASFLLCLIAVTGIFLLAKRQGGFSKWFTKVRETNFEQRFHVVLGRWFLIPLIIVAATGVFLSAEKFTLLPNVSIRHNLEELSSESLNNKQIAKSNLFKQITLDKVRKLTFPFSDDPEDYYQLELEKSELLIQQFSGQVISEISYPFVKIASLWSTKWHTGQGNIVWAIILLLASLSLLFFIFSGFMMTIKRRKKALPLFEKWTKDEAEFIILVGSEFGNTQLLSNAFAKSLVKQGKKVHLASLNNYSTYESASHVIVFTATYGDGDAPTNARKFESLIAKIDLLNEIKFSVIGFGSMEYPKYCLFAIKVDAMLHNKEGFLPLLPLAKINNLSEIAFLDWLNKWNATTGLNCVVSMPSKTKDIILQDKFEVVERTFLNIDNTFLLKLKPISKQTFQSGDLLSIIPPNSTTPRKYSIAEIDGEIVLSVKLHNNGLCSEYLSTLIIGDVILAHIETNKLFHLPKNAPSIYCIANGTGIAPFLGMLQKNSVEPIHLLWGGRGKKSFNLYKEYIEKAAGLKEISNINKGPKTYKVAYSQSRKKTYVQDVLLENQQEVAEKLKTGCVFMICGSMSMQKSVLEVLEEISTTKLKQPFSDFEKNKQLLMDCY